MNSQTTLPISEARKKIFKIAEKVQIPGARFVFTEKGTPKAVMISASEYDSLVETMEILSDPKALSRIKKAESEFAKGEYVSWEKAKESLGWKKPLASAVMDKSKKQYSVKPKKRKKK